MRKEVLWERYMINIGFYLCELFTFIAFCGQVIRMINKR